ncbi:MAG TPA: hypothetical protein VGB42_13245 [Candidatus Thermoplasmatota archaeon]
MRGQRAVAVGLDLRVGVLVEGDAGDFLAAYNAGAIVVLKRGKAGAYLAYGMTAGEVGVVGSAGDAAGAYASGGRVLVYGDAGARAGWRLAGATLVVKGDAGEGAGAGMTGGAMALLGAARGTVGEGMAGGVIYARRDARVDTSCARARDLDAAAAAALKELAAAVKVTAVDPKAFVQVVPVGRAAPAPGQAAEGGGPAGGARVRVVRPSASPDEAKAFVDSVVARVAEEED